jgi:hypothetical protein
MLNAVQHNYLVISLSLTWCAKSFKICLKSLFINAHFAFFNCCWLIHLVRWRSLGSSGTVVQFPFPVLSLFFIRLDLSIRLIVTALKKKDSCILDRQYLVISWIFNVMREINKTCTKSPFVNAPLPVSCKAGHSAN